MKAFLLYADRDLDLERDLPSNEEALTQDLGLNTLFSAMARGDAFLFDVARRCVLTSLSEPDAIVYRQQVLADCCAQPAVAREIYALAVEAIESEKQLRFGWLRDSPDTILGRSVKMLELLVAVLRRLRLVADEHAARFESPGFERFFAMLAAELDESYFETVEAHLTELRFRRGVLISMQLGKGNKGVRPVLRRAREQSWKERIFRERGSSLSFQIADRDDNGFRALAEMRGKGINLVANALAQSTDHILGFFTMLRVELGFLIGCLNVHEHLVQKGEPACFPIAAPAGALVLTATDLYDICLSLGSAGRVVGNDVNADGKRIVMITGANQGGKSTFLRSVGLAQLMLQCGMFVAATSFRGDVCAGLFTHYKREEDAGMQHGKLDEELARMSTIADEVAPDCVLLCNESFAATNEREGSEIARQVVQALVDSGVKVVFVTHMYDLAHGLYRRQEPTALFLRAGREAGGERTFKLVVGEPLPTSFGEDSYRRIFGGEVGSERVAGIKSG